MVSVNNSTSGAEAHLPFGGNGKSGNGSRQSGIWVLDQFTRWQSMNWDYAGKLQKAQMDVMEIDADAEFRLIVVAALRGAIRLARFVPAGRAPCPGAPSPGLRPYRRYQFGEVFGGGTSGSGVRATSTLGSGSATWRASASPNSSSRPSTVSARTPNALRERGEVGRVEVDAVASSAPASVLVVAQHPVAAVVDDHGGQRDPLLRHRGELAAGEQEAAVAGDRDDRAGAGERRAERGRERVAERAPAERELQPARRARACGSRRASSRGCTCRRRAIAVVGQRRSGSRRGSAARRRRARAHASARTRVRGARASASSAVARAHALGERRAPAAASPASTTSTR